MAVMAKMARPRAQGKVAERKDGAQTDLAEDATNVEKSGIAPSGAQKEMEVQEV